MRVGLETRSDAVSQAAPEARRRPHSRLGWVAVLPLFLVLAAFEIAWLLLLAYAAHKFLLQPILEY
jgi:hypothetical protein